MYIYIYIHTYVYIYIYRERGRERDQVPSSSDVRSWCHFLTQTHLRTSDEKKTILRTDKHVKFIRKLHKQTSKLIETDSQPGSQNAPKLMESPTLDPIAVPVGPWIAYATFLHIWTASDWVS